MKDVNDSLELGHMIHSHMEAEISASSMTPNGGRLHSKYLSSEILTQGLRRTPLGGMLTAMLPQGMLSAFDDIMETMDELQQIDLKPERKMKSKKWWRRRNKSHWYFRQTLEKGRKKARAHYPALDDKRNAAETTSHF